MAKLSKRKIQERILKSKIKDLTNKDFAIETFSILKDNQSTSATVGLTLHLILWQIKENKVPKTTSFEQFVVTSCASAKISIYEIFPDDDDDDGYPIQFIDSTVLQLLDNAELVKGIRAPLTPIVKHGVYAIDIKIDQNAIELTDNANEILSNLNSIDPSTPGNKMGKYYSKLAIEYMQKIVDKC